MIDEARNEKAVPACSSGLASWIYPLTVRDFVDQYFEKQHYFGSATESRLGRLRENLFSFDLEQLIAHARGDVQTWYVADGVADYSLKVPPDQAFRFYQAGLTLYFHLHNPEARSDIPFVTELAAQTASDIGVHIPPLVSVFASKQGSVTKPHVDTHCDTLTIQLRGTKIWYVAPREQAPDGWTGDSSVCEAYRLGRGPQLPDGWPKTAHRFELKPGSVLYNPGHYWHEVHSCEESLSLNLNFHRKISWVDVVLPAIERAMRRLESWQAKPVGHVGTQSQRTAARRTLAGLLQRLVSDLSHIELDDVCPMSAISETNPKQITAESTFQRRPLSKLRFHQASENGSDHAAVVTTAASTAEVPLPAELEKIVAWIALQAQPTAVRELTERFNLEFSDAQATLACLCDVGLIRVDT